MVAMHAAKRLKPVLPERGGKAPMIVLEDVDPDEAVSRPARGRHQGNVQDRVRLTAMRERRQTGLA